jgi:hypothetical protein
MNKRLLSLTALMSLAVIAFIVYSFEGLYVPTLKDLVEIDVKVRPNNNKTINVMASLFWIPVVMIVWSLLSLAFIYDPGFITESGI